MTFNIVILSDIEVFEKHPEDISALVGDTITLECITGYSAPNATVWWERDGVKLTSRGDKAVYGDRGRAGGVKWSMKLVLNATLEGAGGYKCVAQNPLSKEIIKSHEALLNVTGKTLLKFNLKHYLRPKNQLF